MNYYAILGLEQRHLDSGLSEQDIKQAYKRALLLHHPDKDNKVATTDGACSPAASSSSGITVDNITAAYSTLVNPTLRAEYARNLRASQKTNPNDASNTDIFRTGLDTVDLDDLDHDEPERRWTRACRCGQQQGFLLTESDLEKHAEVGELVTGCRGCSLWLKVLFSAEMQRDADATMP